MAKIWCDERDCWYNKDCRCRARDVAVYEGECSSCRYDRPAGNSYSRDPQDVRRDRAARKVADRIRDDILARMREALKQGGQPQ